MESSQQSTNTVFFCFYEGHLCGRIKVTIVQNAVSIFELLLELMCFLFFFKNEASESKNTSVMLKSVGF